LQDVSARIAKTWPESEVGQHDVVDVFLMEV
jgi:hypothetical protein